MKPERSATAQNIKRAAIYRAAARRIERELEYACCYAIESAGGEQSDCERMKSLFYNEHEYDPSRRWGHWMVHSDEEVYGRNNEVQDRRILALCFMAAITEKP